MSSTELDISTILKALESGRKISISFSDQISASSFKTAIYRQKKRDEEVWAAVGEEKNKSLSCTTESDEDNIQLTLQLIPLIQKKKYLVTFLDEENEEEVVLQDG